MSVRRETIILEMEDRASRPALGAVGPLQALNAELAALDGRATTASRRFTSMTQRADKLTGSMGNANAALGRTSTTLDAMGSVGLVRFGRQADSAAASLDRFSGRAALLGTAIAAIGPSAFPIAAAAVPALVSLTAGLGAAAGAAGVLMLAFNGVGDAVTAVSDYRLAPTAENLAKVQQAMEDLGPAGASFVMAIDRATPALQDLQRTAREGIFPGWESGLDEVMTQLPGVRNFVADLSSTVGGLGEASAHALVNDADWQEFFDLIGTDGPSALEDFGRATGNVVAGAANLAEALSELTGNRDGLVENARAFREWAANLENTEGFQDFADFARESGPQVAEFLASTGSAMLSMAEAAAPWGQVVLPTLTAFADVVDVVAGSPLGPPLFAATAAMLAFNKASALMGPNLDRAKSSLTGIGASLRQTGADLMTMSSGWSSASKSTARDAAAMTAATGRLKSNLASVGEHARSAGPGIAAFGFMASGAADDMGLSNTALLTMAGAMAGPWGAAAGAAIGLAIDFAKANDEVEKSVTDAATAVASANFGEIGSQMQTAGEAVRQFKADVASVSDGDVDWDLGAYMKGSKNWVEGLFGKSDLEELQERLAKTRTEFSDLVDAGAKLGEEFDIDVGGTQAQKLTALQDLATKAQPAMSALGITFEDLGNAAARGDGSLDVMVGRISAWQSVADSTAGRTEAVGDAIANLGKDALGTAASADTLAAALQGLISPEQDLIAAQDAMSSTLNGLKDKVDATNKSLLGSSDAAIKNRAAISAGVTDINNLAAAQAAAGESSLTVASTMNTQRQALINAGQAAGLSRRQVEALVNQMGLTPDVVRTAFEAAGIEGVSAKTQALAARFNALPKRLRTDIATNGIPKSEADIQRLTAKYNLTPRQVRTLASLRDNASGPIAAVVAALNAADGKTATTTITTVMRTVEQTAAINRERANGGFQENGRLAFADGGYGMDGRYYSRTPQIIPGGANILWGEKETGWEAYISGKPSERERNLQILAMAAERLGAAVTPFANGGSVGAAAGRRRRDPAAAALWQSGHRDPKAALIAGMTVKQLARLGRSFDDISEKRLKRFGRGLERAADLQEKQTDRARDRFEDVRDRRRDIGSGITEGLRGDLWSDNGGSAFGKQFAAGSIGAVNAQLRQETAQGNQFRKDIATLQKKGLNGAALQEIIASGDADRARMYASASRSDVQTYERLYNARQKATAAAGSAGGVALTPGFNALRAEYQKQSRELTQIRKLLAAGEREENRRHNEAQKSREDNGAGPAARKGARNR
ncbi:MAG TPA: hypothetical protein VIP28_09505 [Nocardioides sp.]